MNKDKKGIPVFDNFFDNFTHSIAATRLLLEKAHSQGNLIEGTILYASLVDALLRNIIAIKQGKKKQRRVFGLRHSLISTFGRKILQRTTNI